MFALADLNHRVREQARSYLAHGAKSVWAVGASSLTMTFGRPVATNLAHRTRSAAWRAFTSLIQLPLGRSAGPRVYKRPHLDYLKWLKAIRKVNMDRLPFLAPADFVANTPTLGTIDLPM